MQLSDNGYRLIRSFEGYHRRLPNGDCTTYYCPAGVLTIGFGCTRNIKEGDIWTAEKAEESLRKEIATHEAAVTRVVTVEINQNMYDACVSMAYNVGDTAFANSTLLKRINASDFAAAGREFARWNKGGGKVLPGLVARRAQEAALFAKPVEMPVEPEMPQAVDPPPTTPEGSRKVMVANTGAVSAVSTGAAIAAINVADTFQYGTQALNLVKEHGTSAVLIGLFAVAAAFATIKHYTQQDHAEGRYVPSGETK